MADSIKNFVLGVFEDEDVLLKAITKVRKEGVNIHEVYSPFPVHGIENALGYNRSRLSIAAFLFGMTGTCLALTMMIYMMTIDWPMIIAIASAVNAQKVAIISSVFKFLCLENNFSQYDLEKSVFGQ